MLLTLLYKSSISQLCEYIAHQQRRGNNDPLPQLSLLSLSKVHNTMRSMRVRQGWRARDKARRNTAFHRAVRRMQIKLMGFYRDERRNLRLLTRLDASLGRAALPLFPLFRPPVCSRTQLIKGFSLFPFFRRPHRALAMANVGQRDGRHR